MRRYSETSSRERQKAERTRDWIVLILYVFTIYISLPLMPGLWRKFCAFSGKLAQYSAGLILLATGLYIVFYLAAQRKKLYIFVRLAGLAFCYGWGLSRLELPVERMHFVEYSLLSLFAFKALRHHIKERVLYLYAGMVVFAIGLLDEAIQYILPNRVYDNRDIIVNAASGILGLLVIGLCFQPVLKK